MARFMKVVLETYLFLRAVNIKQMSQNRFAMVIVKINEHTLNLVNLYIV